MRADVPRKIVRIVRKYDPIGITTMARVKARSLMMTSLGRPRRDIVSARAFSSEFYFVFIFFVFLSPSPVLIFIQRVHPRAHSLSFWK